MPATAIFTSTCSTTPRTRSRRKNALPCVSRVFDLVIALGGTLSGEHGIGLAKRDYIGRAIDPVTLNLMKAIKQQFDPKGNSESGEGVSPKRAPPGLRVLPLQFPN